MVAIARNWLVRVFSISVFSYGMVKNRTEKRRFRTVLCRGNIHECCLEIFVFGFP